MNKLKIQVILWLFTLEKAVQHFHWMNVEDQLKAVILSMVLFIIIFSDTLNLHKCCCCLQCMELELTSVYVSTSFMKVSFSSSANLLVYCKIRYTDGQAENVWFWLYWGLHSTRELSIMCVSLPSLYSWTWHFYNLDWTDSSSSRLLYCVYSTCLLSSFQLCYPVGKNRTEIIAFVNFSVILCVLFHVTLTLDPD
jgi:hypothetical protein